MTTQLPAGARAGRRCNAPGPAPERRFGMQKQGSPRRTRVPGHRGVYYRDTAEVRVYEIGFVDSTGAWRWKTIHGDLDAAVAARADIVVKKHRGERVVPEKVTVPEW